MSGARWTFDDHANDPQAPVFPSERRNADGSSSPVTTDALRDGLAAAVRQHLPAQSGRLSPHLLRHFAASDLYRNGMDVVAIQEILGDCWINTTMIYVHVDRTHIEDAWADAGAGPLSVWETDHNEMESTTGRRSARHTEVLPATGHARRCRPDDQRWKDVAPVGPDGRSASDSMIWRSSAQC